LPEAQRTKPLRSHIHIHIDDLQPFHHIQYPQRKMNVFPATMATDPQQQTDEVCQLFSKTLHSLAADAAAIRQISSLAEVSGIQSGNAVTVNDIQNDPSLQQLIEVDRLVTGIEHKVTALRMIVAEEKGALQKFETTLQQEADSQASLVEQVAEAMAQLGVLQERGSSSSSTAGWKSNRSQTTSSNSASKPFKSRRDSVDPRSIKENQSPSLEEDHHHHQQQQQISLRRIAASELKQMSRNTLRRISLLDVNEALDEIERVCDNRLKAMPQSKSTGTSSNSLQRRFEYLKQTRADVDLEVEAHAGHVWVSEQELRENCAFFRHGEATARATLSILCSLKRLKQVPGKNTGVTYICLRPTDSDREVD
jgi:lactam utilization protein B